MQSETKTSSVNATILSEAYKKLDKMPLDIEILPKWKQNLLSRGTKPKMPMGVDALDEATWGLHPGELLVIAGRPGHGKTSLACQIAWNLATKQDALVLFFSLEMSRESVWERLLSLDQSVSGFLMRKGLFPDDFDKRCAEFFKKLSDSRLVIFDCIGWSRTEMDAALQWAHSSSQARNAVVIVDHIQMCSSRGYSSRQEAIADYTRALTEFSIVHSASVIATSQLKRGGAEDEGMDYLKGSGEIEEAASTVISCKWACKCNQDSRIYKDANGSKTMYIADIVKQRHGPTDRIKLTYHADIFKFDDYIALSDEQNMEPYVE